MEAGAEDSNKEELWIWMQSTHPDFMEEETKAKGGLIPITPQHFSAPGIQLKDAIIFFTTGPTPSLFSCCN